MPEWPVLSKAQRKRTAANPSFHAALRVHSTDAPELAQRILRDYAQLELEGIAPTPFLCGDDLLAMGLRAGPEFRVILDAVYDAQLEGSIGSKKAATDLARQLSST